MTRETDVMTATCSSKSTAMVVDNIYTGPVFVRCDCGPNYPVDDDGCCLMCGEDSLMPARECSSFDTPITQSQPTAAELLSEIIAEFDGQIMLDGFVIRRVSAIVDRAIAFGYGGK